MQPFELRGIHLDECPQCGGIWIDQGTFEHILLSAAAQSHALRMIGVMKGSTERKVAYLRCPLCDQQMGRRNYARCSGIIVDFCPSHGFWFDGDELRRVIEFVQSGGFEEAARVDAERAASDAQRRQSADFWFGKEKPFEHI